MAELVRIKILRPFYFAGQPTKKDQIIEVTKFFAIEMANANKAEILPPESEKTIEKTEKAAKKPTEPEIVSVGSPAVSGGAAEKLKK